MLAARVARACRAAFPSLAAAATWSGALVPVLLPTWSAVVALAVAVLVRRRIVVVAAVAVAASVLAANALAGLAPLPSGTWSGSATLVGDPTARSGGTTVDVRTDKGRMELTAWGAAGRVLLGAAAGESVRVEGSLSSIPSPGRVAWRHVRNRLRATRVLRTGSMDWWMRVPGATRSTVVAGARPLPAEQRPVYLGFVIGDDRGQSDEVARWFESAGLLHLLVVSGENLVFVLLVVGPVLERLGRRMRFASTIAVLVLFAAVTRFEPSVLRATAMALIAAGAVVTDRRTTGRRSLAIAVTALVLVDPLLVRSLGFVLSVAASAGIVLLAPAIERGLRGPRRLRTVLAVSIAAQLAVAPVLVPRFGPMPLIAVPANVLAEPVAGLVMMWGTTAGIVAGLVGGPVAAVLQAPTRVGLGWIIGVARVADGLPDFGLGLPALVAFCGGSVLVVRTAAHRRSSRLRSRHRAW